MGDLGTVYTVAAIALAVMGACYAMGRLDGQRVERDAQAEQRLTRAVPAWVGPAAGHGRHRPLPAYGPPPQIVALPDNDRPAEDEEHPGRTVTETATALLVPAYRRAHAAVRGWALDMRERWQTVGRSQSPPDWRPGELLAIARRPAPGRHRAEPVAVRPPVQARAVQVRTMAARLAVLDQLRLAAVTARLAGVTR